VGKTKRKRKEIMVNFCSNHFEDYRFNGVVWTCEKQRRKKRNSAAAVRVFSHFFPHPKKKRKTNDKITGRKGGDFHSATKIVSISCTPRHTKKQHEKAK